MRQEEPLPVQYVVLQLFYQDPGYVDEWRHVIDNVYGTLGISLNQETFNLYYIMLIVLIIVKLDI